MPVTSTLDKQAQKVTGKVLQAALADLLDLSLAAKQLHWNITGRNFRSLHLQLDEVVAFARLNSDTVAERAVAIGVNPQGRAADVVAGSGLPEATTGWVKDVAVVKYMIACYDALADRFRERISATEEADPVTNDLMIQITAELEKMRWMFQAENA